VVPVLFLRRPPEKNSPQKRPDGGAGIVFDLLSVCAAHETRILSMSYGAPESVDVNPGFVSGSGCVHSERCSNKEPAGEDIFLLEYLLQLRPDFKSGERGALETAVNRSSSSLIRKRGRFWLRDRIPDAALCLEVIY